MKNWFRDLWAVVWNAVESHKTIGNQANKFLTNKKVHTASQKQTCLTEHRMMYDSIYLWLSPMKSDLTIDSMPVPLRRVCATKPKTIASCKTLQIIRKWTRILVSLGSIISRFFSSRNEDRPRESDRNGTSSVICLAVCSVVLPLRSTQTDISFSLLMTTWPPVVLSSVYMLVC